MAAKERPETTGKPAAVDVAGLFGDADVVVVDSPTPDSPVIATPVTPAEAEAVVAGRRRPVIEVTDDNTGTEVGRAKADPTQVALEAEQTFGK